MAFGLAGPFLPAPQPWGGNVNLSSVHMRRTRKQRCAQVAWTLPSFLPGRKFQFDRVRVEKNKSIPHAEIRSVFDSLLSRPVSRSDVTAAVDTLSEWYRSQGFLFSAVKVTTWPTDKFPLLVLECMESTLDSVNLISVSKDGVPDPKGPALRTRVGTVERALGVKVGFPFRWEDDKFSHLMSLGVFEKAKVEVNIVAEDKVKLNVYLNEAPTARIEPGVGMNGDGRIFGDVSVLDNNFMGRAQMLRVEWQRRLDMVRSAGGLEFVDPRIGASVPLSYKVRAYRKSDSARGLPAENAVSEMRVGPFRSTTSPDLDSDRDGAFFLASYDVARLNTSITTGPIAERVHWAARANDAWHSVRRDQFAWKTAIYHSTIKSSASPGDGHHFSVEHFVGALRHETENVFQKLGVTLSKHVPVGRFGSFVFNSSISVASGNLPRHEMVPLGGNRTVRGYVYGELGRSPSYRTTRLEYRIPFPFKEVDDSVEQYIHKGKRPGKKNGKPTAGMPPLGPKIRGPPTFLERLPSLVGYVFADSATSGAFESVVSGSSHGVGLRVAGLINFEFARAAHGRAPRINVTLVDPKNL